jgi:hypothetical protein
MHYPRASWGRIYSSLDQDRSVWDSRTDDFASLRETTAAMNSELVDSNQVANVFQDGSRQSLGMHENCRDGCATEPFRNGSVIGKLLQKTI